MRTRTRAAVTLGVAVVTACSSLRYEAWEYRNADGSPAFESSGLLLPWQEAEAGPAQRRLTIVEVRRWSLLGLSRFEYKGPPGLLPGTGEHA